MAMPIGTLKIRQVLSATAAVTAIMAAQGALAQDTTTTLAPIVVEGNGTAEAANGPVKGYVAKKSTAGSKSDTEISDIPQSVSVVGRQELDDRGVVNKVDEALRYTAGVAAEPFGTDPDTDWLYIRGFDATQTGMFFDGLNLFSYGFGGFQIDPFALERVDVLKGPASVLYGGGNAGGLVDLIRKRPTDEPYYYTEIGINSNGNAFSGFDISDTLGDSGAVSYRLTGKLSGGDNYSDFSEDLRGFIMPQVTVQRDDATKITVWGYASGLDQTHTGNGFFPYFGTVANAPIGKIDRKAFYGEPSIDTGRYNQQMIGAEFEHQFDNGLKFSSNARYGHLYKHENAPYLYGYYNPADIYTPLSQPFDAQNLLNRLGFEHTSKANTFAIDNRIEGEVQTGAVAHEFMIGLDYKYYQLDNKQASSPTNPISATNPIYGIPQGPNAVYSNQLITQNQIGIYAQDQARFGDGWLLTLNGRYDYVTTDTDNRATAYGTAPDYDFTKSALSGRAGLAYEFDNGITPYVSVGTFFNPTIATSQTPYNKPEEGEQYEVGVKYEPAFIDGVFTASLFNLTKRNVVVSTGAPLWLSSQIGEVQSRGIELEGKVNLDDNWKLLGSFSYTDLEVKDDIVPAYIGKSPYVVPNVQASLWVDYAFTSENLEGLSLGGGVRYQGESWADRLNTLKVPGATVFDAALRYKKNGWEGALNVTNLFDKTYVEGCAGEFTCGYGDARTITLKLSKTW